jgi:hypothetical protein
MDYWDRCAIANAVVLVLLTGGAATAWFVLMRAPWYAHAGAVAGIGFAAWYVVDRVLSAHVNRWMKRPGDPRE